MRIRSIKPEFWRSQDISSIEDWSVRFIFIGLWSYVDDNGVGKDRVALIAADLFADDLERDPRETFARVSVALARLSEAGRIVRYAVDGTAYLEVTNWDRHQRIDKPNKPRYPRFTSENAEIRESVAESSRDSSDIPAPGTGEQGNRGRGTEEQKEQASPQAAAAKTVRRKRIPDEYMPDRHVVNKVKAEFPSVPDPRLRTVHEDFCLYWQGQGRPMADWDATWLRWMRKELPKFNTTTESVVDSKVNGWLDLANQQQPLLKAIGE